MKELHIPRENSISPATGSQQKYKVHQTEPQSAGSPEMKQALRLWSLQGQSSKPKSQAWGERGSSQREGSGRLTDRPSFQAALPEHICSEEEPLLNGSLPLLLELWAGTDSWPTMSTSCTPADSPSKYRKIKTACLLNKTFAWSLFPKQYNPTIIYIALTLH